MTPLQQRMIEDMTVRGLVPSTQRAYLRAVRDLTAYDKRRPDTLSTRDIQRYLLMLHEERGLTYSTCNTIVHGLRFFYGTTLGRSAMHFVIPLAKEPSTLPLILRRHDIRQLFAAAESLRDQTLLKVTYNAGLRASEVVHLTIGHIDSHRMCLRVEQGKRQKDREALLSPDLLQALRVYWRVYRPALWLFPGRNGTQPLALQGDERMREGPTDVGGGIEGDYSVVTSVVTMQGDPDTYHHLKLFTRQPSGEWQCVYWRVTRLPGFIR